MDTFFWIVGAGWLVMSLVADMGWMAQALVYGARNG